MFSSYVALTVPSHSCSATFLFMYKHLQKKTSPRYSPKSHTAIGRQKMEKYQNLMQNYLFVTAVTFTLCCISAGTWLQTC